MKEIKKFFKNLIDKIFNRNKILTIEEKSTYKTEERRNIKEEIKININSVLLQVQEQYENGELNINNMSNSKIKELVELYQNQIKELDYKIANKI